MLRKKNVKLAYKLKDIDIHKYNLTNSFKLFSHLDKNNIETTLVAFLDINLFDIIIKDIKLKEIIINILNDSTKFTQNHIDELLQDINVTPLSPLTLNLFNSLFKNFILSTSDIDKNNLFILNDINIFNNINNNSYGFHYYSEGSFIFNVDDLILVLKNIIITKLLYLFEDNLNKDYINKYQDFLKLFSRLVIQKIVPPEKSGIIFTDNKNKKLSIYCRFGARSINLYEYDTIDFSIKSAHLEIKHVYPQEFMNIIKLSKNRIGPVRTLNIKIDEANRNRLKIEEEEIINLLKIHKLLEACIDDSSNYILFWIINSGKLYIENISVLPNKFIKVDEVDKISKNVYQNIHSSNNQNYIKESNTKNDRLNINLNNEKSALNANNINAKNTKLAITDFGFEEVNNNLNNDNFISNHLKNPSLSYTVLKLDDLIGSRLISLIKPNKFIATVDDAPSLYLKKNSNVLLDISDMGSNKIFKSIYYDKLFLDLEVLLRLNDYSTESINLLDLRNKKGLFNKLLLNFQIVLNAVKLKNNKLFIKLFFDDYGQLKNIKNILELQIQALLEANKSININYNRISFVLPVLSFQFEYEFIVEELNSFKKEASFALDIAPEIILPSTLLKINSFRGMKYIFIDTVNLVRLLYNQNEISEELQKDFIKLLDNHVLSLLKKRKSLELVFKTSESLKIINKFLKNKNFNLLLVKYLLSYN